MGLWWAGRVRQVWAGLVVATRTRRAATCPHRLHVPRRQGTQVLGPHESLIRHHNGTRVSVYAPHRHLDLREQGGMLWRPAPPSPRPAHTATLAHVCTPPHLWLASASPGPAPVCAAPSPAPTPAGVCGLAQPLCRRDPHSRTGWDVAGVRLARAVGDDAAAQAGAGHGQPSQPVLATEARPPPPRPPQRRHGRTQPGCRPRLGGLGRPDPPPLQSLPSLTP